MHNNRVSMLIVDDGQYVRELLMDWLSPHYDCVSAASLEEATQLLSTHSFHLVITDIMLPDGSGLDVCQLVKRSAPHTSVVAISGAANSETRAKALSLGAVHFLKKPFDLLEIRTLIDNTLSG